MKVLVCTHHDSDNIRIINVLAELKRRGHELGIYGFFLDEQNIRMLKPLGEPIHRISELTQEIVDVYDCIFCALHTQGRVKYENKYIFFFNHYFDDHWRTQGADFMFTAYQGQRLRFPEDCSSMAVGDPKNDTVVVANPTVSKRILYIDTGHYPFGSAGKEQVVDMLLEICEKFPDYELCIKPRWLPNLNTNITHRNSLHIFDLIKRRFPHGKIPSNLNMLEKHCDMQKLLDSCCCAITTASSAYWDVVLRNKNLIIAEGFENEDKVEIRNDIEIKECFDQKRSSGCVVNYKEVTRYLPMGIRCSDAHIDSIMAYRTGASTRIVDVMEYVFDQFLAQGKFPAQTDYSYETYKSKMIADEKITYDTLKVKRIKNCLAEAVLTKYHFITVPLDTSILYAEIEDSCNNIFTGACDEENYQKLLQRFQKTSREFIIGNSHVLSDDPINQSFVLQSLYDEGRNDDILALNEEHVLCKSPYHFYLGKIYQQNSEITSALIHYVLFLREAITRSFAKYPQEENWGIGTAYNFIFDYYNGDNINPVEFAELYVALYEQYQEPIAAYKSRKRAHNYLPKVAEQLKDTSPEQALKCLQLYAKYEYHYNIRERNERIGTLERDVANLREQNKQFGVLEREIASLRGSKVYRSAQAVTWPFRRLKGGIKCWRENGFKYTVNRLRQKAGSWISAKAPAIHRIWEVFSKKVLGGYALYKGMMEKYGENAQILLSSAALGDNYLLGRCVGAYMSKQYPDRTPVFCVYGKQGVDIANLFGIGHSEPFNMADYQILINLFMFIDNKLIHLNLMHHHIVYRHTGILMHVEGLHGFNLSTIGMAYLDVEEAELQSPKFVYEDNFIFDLFSMHSLSAGKTVLLSPYAKSVKQIPVRFWERLAAELLKKGYHVCTNSAGEFEPTIKNTLPLLIPLRYAVPFIERAGIYIGLRSGLSDVLSSAKAVKIVLHPRANYKRGLVRDINYSYSMIGMYHQPNQYELIYSNENENELLHDIMQAVGQTNGH